MERSFLIHYLPTASTTHRNPVRSPIGASPFRLQRGSQALDYWPKTRLGECGCLSRFEVRYMDRCESTSPQDGIRCRTNRGTIAKNCQTLPNISSAPQGLAFAGNAPRAMCPIYRRDRLPSWHRACHSSRYPRGKLARQYLVPPFPIAPRLAASLEPNRNMPLRCPN